MDGSSDQANPNAPLTGSAAHVSAQGLVLIVWIGFGMATMSVALRCVVRGLHKGGLKSEDYWILFAWSCLLTMSILQMQQIDSLWYIAYLQAGRIPVTAEAPQQFEQLVRWEFPIINVFWMSLWCVKASFLAVFFGLVHPIPLLRRLWYCVGVFTALAYLGCVLSSVLTCSNPSDYFRAGRCTSPHEQWMTRFNVIFSTSMDIITDLGIMALPLGILTRLHLDLRKKVGLGVAFSVALITIGVAVIRMSRVLIADRIDLPGLAIWGAIEAATAVVVGSLAPLKAFLTRGFRTYAPKLGGQRPGARGHQNGPSNESESRSARINQSLPLDDLERYSHGQTDGSVYILRPGQWVTDAERVDGRGRAEHM